MHKKKLIIIISVLSIIIIGGFLYFIFKPSKNDIPTEVPINKEEAYWSKVQEIYQENLSRAQTEKIPELKYGDLVPLNTYYTVTSDDCAKLSGQERKNCYEEVKLYEIVNGGVVDSCYELATYKDECLNKFARTGDFKFCLDIENEKIKEKCLSDNAYFNLDMEICNHIDEEDDKIECFDRYKAMVNGGVLPDENKGEMDKCKEIKTLEYFNQCVLRSQGACEELGDEELAGKCNSIRGFLIITESDDKANCALLPNFNYFRVCEIYFDNDKVMIDSDGDKLLDDQELWFDTDPFTVEAIAEELTTDIGEHEFITTGDGAVTNSAYQDTDGDGLTDEVELKFYFTDPTKSDTDGDGYSDSEEIKNGYNPLGE